MYCTSFLGPNFPAPLVVAADPVSVSMEICNITQQYLYFVNYVWFASGFFSLCGVFSSCSCSDALHSNLLDGNVTSQFTSAAYTDRTSLPCAKLSFNDIAEGDLPLITSDISKIQIQPHNQGYGDNSHSEEHIEIKKHINVNEPSSLTLSAYGEPYSTIEMIVCSFALHLIETQSELFALLCVLSFKARWLVVLTPNKKPEVRFLFLYL